jgi:mono/diheme cytochrome c family protein
MLLAALAVAGMGAARADEAAAPRFTEGAKLFSENCAVCHRANGSGQAGLAPPLTHNPARYVASAEGRRQLAMTVLNGMFGEIEVDDRHFNFKMPEFSRFDDETLTKILNFVAFDIASAPAGIEPLQVADLARERATPMSGDAVRRHRAEVLAASAP